MYCSDEIGGNYTRGGMFSDFQLKTTNLCLGIISDTSDTTRAAHPRIALHPPTTDTPYPPGYTNLHFKLMCGGKSYHKILHFSRLYKLCLLK